MNATSNDIVEKSRFDFRSLLPGILIAATGVGAGDLLTAGFAGSKLGPAILWAVIFGAGMKYVLNEGLARWQLATGTTLMEGWHRQLGHWIRWVFLIYLLVWSLAVGGALISACGVAGASLIPIFSNGIEVGTVNDYDRYFWGFFHSILGVVLVRLGGFRIFEITMSVLIGLMFILVTGTALSLGFDGSEVLSGLFIPEIPHEPQSVGWVLGLIGGVGGTVTLLSYGYWIQEEGRMGATGVRASRLDLGVGYALTALFGISMVLIGSRVDQSGSGAAFAVQVALQLETLLGKAGYWAFLLGFWGAVFSSLLGVWQGVPYLFADFMRISSNQPRKYAEALRTSNGYKYYLYGIAILPLFMLFFNLKQVQLVNAIFGALFMPLLAITLLFLNNSRSALAPEFRNSWFVNVLLFTTLVFFAWTGIPEMVRVIASLRSSF